MTNSGEESRGGRRRPLRDPSWTADHDNESAAFAFLISYPEPWGGLGRVVHFHSFRKTWQTLGVPYGINQRAAQEVLGHSDANLTAKVYTDVPALALHDEVAKLPWLSVGDQVAQIDAQKSGNPSHPASLADICAEFDECVNIADAEGFSHVLSSLVTSLHNSEMAARAGSNQPLKHSAPAPPIPLILWCRRHPHTRYET